MRHVLEMPCTMTEVPTERRRILLAELAILLIVVFIVLGVTLCLSSAYLVERPSGPMTFRFLLQPTMAVTAAFYDGIKDAKFGRSPYLWNMLLNPATRGARLHEGLISTARIILLGLCMDVIYQFIEFKTFHPAEAVIIALLLAFVPYVLLRGPIARIVCWWRGVASADENR